MRVIDGRKYMLGFVYFDIVFNRVGRNNRMGVMGFISEFGKLVGIRLRRVWGSIILVIVK